MDWEQLSRLPSPFYRVSVKALIFDEQNRLLVGRGEEDSEGWEIPGGGWEHSETLEECVKREIEEELGIKVLQVGQPLFVYKGRSKHGWMIARVAVPAKLEPGTLKYGEITESKYVTKQELKNLNFAASEGTILEHIDRIWP